MKTILAAIVLLLAQPLSRAADPEYLASYDPAKGFKPAMRDLTEIYLQLAGSLEAHGSPEPYLRHVANEHDRIENLYRSKFGRDPKSFRPASLTDVRINKLSANWKFLAGDLELEPFTKEFGHMMRDAIKGTRGNGTIIITIFNQHQNQVLETLSGKAKTPVNFEDLREELVKKLELDQKVVNEGQYEVVRRDAVRAAIILHGMTMKLFSKFDAGLSPADAAKVKAVIYGVIINVGEMAESELQAGISEQAFERLSASN